MCFSISFIETSPQKYAENYSRLLQKDIVTPDIETFPSYYFVSGFQFPLLPIVLFDKIQYSYWGLIPYWTKDKTQANQIKNKTLNAVGETVFEKPSYKKAITKQRCVLGIQGFYEWREVQHKKYPYFIYSSKNEMLSLGCIYDNWIDTNTGEIISSFSIITTQANAFMQKIHNTKKRMPLILPNDKIVTWLDNNTSNSAIQSLIQPCSENFLTAHTISPIANYSKENRNIPTIIQPFYYSELIE